MHRDRKKRDKQNESVFHRVEKYLMSFNLCMYMIYVFLVIAAHVFKFIAFNSIQIITNI